MNINLTDLAISYSVYNRHASARPHHIWAKSLLTGGGH
jgi:hypothetical protein